MSKEDEKHEYTEEEKKSLRKNRAFIFINTCCDCPLYTIDANKVRFYCGHNGKDLWWSCSKEEDVNAIPDWCPILKNR